MAGYGVLFIHGIRGSPAEMGKLPTLLKESGFEILNPLLVGHDSEENLQKISAKDYFLQIEKEFSNLSRKCPKGVFVIGHSMGGALTLFLASKFQDKIKGIVILSTPFGLSWIERLALTFLRFLPWKFSAKKNEADFSDQVAAKSHKNHKKFFFKSIFEFMRVLEIVKKKISSVQIPALIICSEKDDVINPIDSEIIFSKISSKEKEIIKLKNGKHAILVDSDRDIAISKIVEFIGKHIS